MWLEGVWKGLGSGLEGVFQWGWKGFGRGFGRINIYTKYYSFHNPPEVHIEHSDGDNDGERDQHHGEEQILSQQRHRQRGGRNNLGQQQEEHGERQQDADTERDLLAGITGQVEDQDREERDAHAGDDQVHGVEERLPSQSEVKHDVQIGLLAAAVELLVPHRRHPHDIPLH